MIQAFVNGLAAASHYTRQNRGEAVEIFAKWVPGVNLEVARSAIQHINKDARPLAIDDIVLARFTRAAEAAYPEYFRDLPPLK